jgi:hypothetical protein
VSESRDQDPIERAVELFVFAPIGAALFVRDAAPSVLKTVVARGRAEVDKRQDEVSKRMTSARSLGQVAIAFGVPILRQKVSAHLGEVRTRGEQLVTRPEAETPTTPPAPRPRPTIVREPVAVPDSAPESDELPIPGYDALSASQVVERLAGLGRDELDAVHAYEASHRQRRTILGKIEQLAG